MPFSQYQIYAPAAGASGIYSYLGNSVYDPDFSGAGNTAGFYSSLFPLYNRYRVLGSKLTIEANNTGTVPLRIYLIASVANTPPSVTYLPQQRHIAMGASTPSIAWDHTAQAATSKIFGVPQSQILSEDDFAGLIGASPNNVWYWHIVVYNPSGVAGACNVQVRIEYETVWSMPLNYTV
jgi:hypothetical protein